MKLWLHIGVLVLWSLAGCTHHAPAPPAVSTATVLAQPRQTIKGWGCYPSTFQLDRPNASNYHIYNRPNAQKLLFKELGFSYFRAEILPDSYDARRNDGSLDAAYIDGSLVRWLKLARSYGHSKYILSVWSPPAVFKTPAVLLGQSKGVPTKLRRDRESAYCRYIVRVFDHLQKRKLAIPFAFSIQNEPGYDPPLWNGTAYDGVQWRRVFKRMRVALDRAGYKSVQLIGPECGSYSLNVDWLGGTKATQLKSDPQFAKALSGFAFHGYAVTSRRAPHPQNLRAVAEVARGLKKDIWLSEWSILVPRSPLDHTLEVAQRLGRETSYIPTNYWTWWQGWYYKHPKSEVLITGSDDRNLHISKTYYLLQKLWHSAPAGSVVHRVRTTDRDITGYDPYRVQAVAFQYKKRLTVLLTNPTSNNKTFSLRGLTGRDAKVFRTDSTSDMKLVAQQKVVGSRIGLELPPRSISLVVCE